MSHTTMTTEHYKGYMIEPYFDGYQNTFRGYPTDHGPDDDYDFDGDGYVYCGNCFFGDIDWIKDEIDEKTEGQRFQEEQLVMLGDLLCRISSYDSQREGYYVTQEVKRYAWSSAFFQDYRLKPLMHTVISN